MRFFYFFLIGLLLLFYLSFCTSEKKDAYHAFLESADFQKLERAEQLKKCGSCHQREFENELKGPHYNAFKYLKEHVEFVNSSLYDCYFYRDHVNESYTQCKSCHAPQNLYETLLYDSLGSKEKTLAKLMSISNPRPLPREDNELLTGIDCLSCHLKNGEIHLARTAFNEEDSTLEKQTRATILENNLLCYACHSEVVRSINPAIAMQRTGVVRCTSCHQEYSNGQGTHYYFWQHEAEGKHNPKIEKILADFTYLYDKSNKQVLIQWLNRSIPHKISSGPEMVFYCNVLDNAGRSIARDTIRINKKAEFDKIMYKHMQNNYHLGVYGIDVPTDDSPRIFSVSLANASVPDSIEITFVHKSQYWFPDSLGSELTVKKFLVLPSPAAL